MKRLSWVRRLGGGKAGTDRRNAAPLELPAAPASRRTLTSALLMGLLFLVLIGSLYVLGTMALRLDRFGRYYHWLLVGNGVALAFIAILLGMNGWRLVGEFRRQVAGARLTVKLVIVSVLLALVPVTLVYGFSVRFLRANINSYFDLEIERTLDDALELARASLDLQMRTLQRDTLKVADALVGIDDDDSAAVIALNALTDDTDASEMTLIGPDNRIVASTGLLDDITVQPDRPDDDLTSRARQGLSYVGVDPGDDGELYVRVVTPVLSSDAALGHAVLQALYPVARRSSDLAMSVQSSYQHYRQLVFLRRPLMVSSMLTLSLALLLSVMMSVWFAFYAARRMMLPVHDLVEGTRAIAGGDYGTRIDRRGKNDELGFLVHSFNRMTLQIEQSRAHAEQSRRQVERQRAWLQTVLGHISSGVITLEGAAAGEPVSGTGARIRSANDAAVDILGDALAELEGETLASVSRLHGASVLAQFVEGIEGHLAAPELVGGEAADWSLELPVIGESGRRFLLCRGAVLVDADGRTTGQVIVIDDMTALIGAQRDAAWSEVARRLAHEIKNPLTPIQLSAERLRHKFARKLAPDDVALLTRLTHTIENQVDALKSMVNAFADYASTPRLDLVDTDVNALVRELAELYGAGGGEAAGVTGFGGTIELELDESLPRVPLDTPRLRQLVHNLIKNALEAQQSQPTPMVRIVTRRATQRGRSMLEIVTLDEGPGFAPELLDRLFEPYVTSKPRGTGLGLAVVRKIVEEHDGTIRAENRPGRGASVTVALPWPNALQLRESAA